MKKPRLIAFVLAALAAFAAISARAGDQKDDVNAVGRRNVAHSSIISQEKEVAIGRQYAEQINRSAKLIKDPVITEYVNRVAQNVARKSDLKIPLTVQVIDSPSINAFALPGGFLYVDTGLIQAADREDQLAGVIAHEIAHVAARHWAGQVTKATWLQYATLPLIFTPMSYPVYAAATEAYNVGVPLTFLKFSRNDEAEADFLGIQYMYKAGYDPRDYVTFFGKIIAEERRAPGSVPKIFMDHPPTPERMIKADQEIKTILPPRDHYLVSTSEFNDVRARIVAVIENQKKGRQESGPTLAKRGPNETASNQTQAPDSRNGQDDDRPPVLRRRDE